ncbi:MAG: hypothetical protein HYY93_14225 [Planctomycetes bacterium]|nr:hypothetical protein [Planctomycetota bacterium]
MNEKHRIVVWTLALVAVGLATALYSLWDKDRRAPAGNESHNPLVSSSLLNSTGSPSIGCPERPSRHEEAPDARISGRTPGDPDHDSALPQGMLELYEAAVKASGTRRLFDEAWRRRVETSVKWSEADHSWGCGGFTVDWPSMALVRWGSSPDKNMPEEIPMADLDSWFESQVQSGSAITLDKARELAERFLHDFVSDWRSRNYQAARSGWTSYGKRGQERDKETSVWYYSTYLQTPYREFGEIGVNEVPITIYVDPFSSEILLFNRNRGERLEPRLAFYGPVFVDEARARQIWEEAMRPSLGGASPKMKVFSGPTVTLQVDVAWDAGDKAKGTLIWNIEWGAITLADRNVEPSSRSIGEMGGIGGTGRMKMDAYTGNVLLFSPFE